MPKQYEALVDLYDVDNKLIAAAGTTTDKIAACSIGWLTEQGLIREAAIAAPAGPALPVEPAPTIIEAPAAPASEEK